MAVTDIASRTCDHGWQLDPVVCSLLDADFYKLLMPQMVREFCGDQHTTYSVINHSPDQMISRDARRTARPISIQSRLFATRRRWTVGQP